jgi:hypothetical protein
MFCQRSLPGDCRLLLSFISDGRESSFGGYSDEEAYIREGLGLDPEAVSWAIRGLELTGSQVPVPFSEAVVLGKRGGDRRSAAVKDQGSDTTLIGRGRAYILARLDRDRPDLATRVRTEELSANAAAIEAGFKKKPTPLDVLRSAWRKASDEERDTFREEIDDDEGAR